MKHCITIFVSLAITMLSVPVTGSAAEGVWVKIVNRQDSSASYTYHIPGHSTSSGNNSATCIGDSTQVNCSGNSRVTTTTMAPRSGSYEVQGATFSLLLPDGRIAVVNCNSKYSPKGDYVNKRSCRMPIVDQVYVEFNGSKAKLRWSVSLDGKKFDSETYKVLGVLDKSQVGTQ
jgi:hypothetical protein